ncbi:hypothetical protein THMIRHAS_01220 [Thiosulfatimonas sediminis]|uniref:Thioredoxin-like fold domain-containing protein n=1 Tax=Thiosulfatimonas sediminis TaxID=2675054 RepID=A0A6F8PRL1_9GAMM|nr:thioredoxin fold domain-containing protein [Thiosulfatimonas sediminis]BBP44749.1 hypothetical protein THMIRHAS_01220 [Thiosulfatimonas sediminis]
MLSNVVTRISLIGLLAFQAGCDSTALAGKQHSLPELQDLQSLGAQAKANELPIMLMFSAQWCDYCVLLKEQVLNPMSINGLYEGKVMYLRNVAIDEDDPIPDWQGKPLKKRDWAYQINADLTPTIVFFDGHGKEVAERIVGISEVTMFAGVVHNRLNQAYQNMGLQKRIPATPELLEIQQQMPPQ